MQELRSAGNPPPSHTHTYTYILHPYWTLCFLSIILTKAKLYSYTNSPYFVLPCLWLFLQKCATYNESLVGQCVFGPWTKMLL